MAAAAPKLRVLPPPEPRPLDLARENRRLRRAMADVKRDLSAGIDSLESAIWSGNRAHALNQLGRLGLRVQAIEADDSPRPLRSA